MSVALKELGDIHHWERVEHEEVENWAKLDEKKAMLLEEKLPRQTVE